MKTAIEQLRDMINEYPCAGLTDSKLLDDVMTWIDDVLLEAEKNQIINAYNQGYDDHFSYNPDYYNQTFKN